MSKVVLALMACLLLCVGTAQAERILIDFGGSDRPTVSPDASGLSWTNQTAMFDYMSLGLHSIGNVGQDTAGNALAGFEMFSFNCAGGSSGGVQASNLYPATAQSDSIVADATFNPATSPLLVAITGLPSASYDLMIFGSRDSNTNTRTGHWLINGQDQTLDAAMNAGGHDPNGDPTGVIVFKNVPVGDVTIGGEVKHNAILISMYSASIETVAQFGYMGVLDMTAVPEPASIGLLVLGALAVLRRRRA